MSKRYDPQTTPSSPAPAGDTATFAAKNDGRGRDDALLRGKKILYLVTEDWYFCSHRLPIARAARDAGMKVVVATRVDRHGERITGEGFGLVDLPWRRRSRNLFREIFAFVRLLRLYRKERPDVVHHVAMKPVLYGAVAALLTGVPRQVNAVAGFGYVFTSKSTAATLLRPLFRTVFRRVLNRPGSCVVVQNPDDRDAMIAARMSAPENVRIIKGSGVDTDYFVPGSEPDGVPTVTLVSRMLWSKGVAEMVEAARILRSRGVTLRVWLVGDPDPENPESVPEEKLRGWHDDGLVEWKGHVENIRGVMASTTVAVLPSYREGLPKTMLEAASCGLPAVATDVPGCREVVRHGENGLLVPPRDAAALADAIARLLADGDLRRTMGERGRRIAVEFFSEKHVVDQTMAVYRAALAAPGEKR